MKPRMTKKLERKTTRKIFEEFGGRQALAERVLEIAREIIDTNSYKRAIVGAGQIQALADLCESDSYWDEKRFKGYCSERRNISGHGPQKFGSSGEIDWHDAEVGDLVLKRG